MTQTCVTHFFCNVIHGVSVTDHAPVYDILEEFYQTYNSTIFNHSWYDGWQIY